jgi:hypothetical protein
MNTDRLLTHANDHLAGSVTALEMIEHLREATAGSELGRFLDGLHGEITQDQEVLRDLIHRLGGTQSAVKKAAGWLAQKMTQANLAVTNPDEDKLELFQSLEALPLGILGKRALWQALSAPDDPAVPLTPRELARLTQRAEHHHARVEERRVRAAREAFG